MECNICLSEENINIGEHIFMCSKCKHVFTDYKFEDIKDFFYENGILNIKKYSSSKLFFDIETDSIYKISAENFLEYSNQPFALICDLYRISNVNVIGKIIVSKGNMYKNYFSYGKLRDLFEKAGFQVKGQSFFSQIKSLFSKKITIEFYK